MNLNFKDICRLCLRFCEKYVDLSQTSGVRTLSKELAEKIKFCYLIQMDLTGGLPTKVCYECIQVISFFEIAKKNVVISEQLLRDVLCMTGSKIIKVKPKKEKIDQSFLATYSNSLNLSNDKSNCGKNSESICTSNIKCNEDISMPSNSAEVVSTNCEHHSEFKVRTRDKIKFKDIQNHSNQNSELGKDLNASVNISKGSLKFKVSKKLKSQLKRIQSCTDNIATKEESKSDMTDEEYVVKNIGTVIDTSNILSPNKKRLRKSVLAK